MQKLRPIPSFANEAEERAFWERHDSTDYVDWSKAERVRFANLKPSTKSISLRLPGSLLDEIKIAANKRDVPYQSLIKVWLAERLAAENLIDQPECVSCGHGACQARVSATLADLIVASQSSGAVS